MHSEEEEAEEQEAEDIGVGGEMNILADRAAILRGGTTIERQRGRESERTETKETNQTTAIRNNEDGQGSTRR